MAKKKRKKSDVYPRDGYTVITFRARDEVAAVIDEAVDAWNASARVTSLGEPKVTRTTLLLEAVRHYFGLAGGEAKSAGE